MLLRSRLVPRRRPMSLMRVIRLPAGACSAPRDSEPPAKLSFANLRAPSRQLGAPRSQARPGNHVRCRRHGAGDHHRAGLSLDSIGIAGLGIAFISLYTVASELADGRLVVLDIAWSACDATMVRRATTRQGALSAGAVPCWSFSAKKAFVTCPRGRLYSLSKCDEE